MMQWKLNNIQSLLVLFGEHTVPFILVDNVLGTAGVEVFCVLMIYLQQTTINLDQRPKLQL